MAELRRELGSTGRWWFSTTWLGGIPVGLAIRTCPVNRCWRATPIAVTSWLVGFGMIGSLLLALPAGMVAACRSWPGSWISAAAQVGMAIPVFWGGILLVVVFAAGWLPANGTCRWLRTHPSGRPILCFRYSPSRRCKAPC